MMWNWLAAAIVAWNPPGGVESAMPPDRPIDGGSLAVRTITGFREPAAPTAVDGAADAPANVVEVHDAAPAGGAPQTVADLVSNTYTRLTYLTPTGGARFGTSVVASPSFRSPGNLLNFLPTVDRADVTTGGPDRVRVALSAHFGDLARESIVRTYPRPVVGRTTAGIATRFEALREIPLDPAALGRDAFRLLTVSSMFSTIARKEYDANVVRFEDAAGVVRTVRLDDSTPRDAYLFPSPVPLGPWFELIKEPGASWFGDSPSTRVEIVDRSSIAGRLAIQGYLIGSKDPNDDSLSVWVEWIDAPRTIAAGAILSASVRLSASPPAPAAR